MLSTIDLHINVVCFVKNIHDIFIIKRAYLNWLVQGGKLYWAFPFSKTSKEKVMDNPQGTHLQ